MYQLILGIMLFLFPTMEEIQIRLFLSTMSGKNTLYCDTVDVAFKDITPLPIYQGGH